MWDEFKSLFPCAMAVAIAVMFFCIVIFTMVEYGKQLDHERQLEVMFKQRQLEVYPYTTNPERQ